MNLRGGCYFGLGMIFSIYDNELRNFEFPPYERYSGKMKYKTLKILRKDLNKM